MTVLEAPARHQYDGRVLADVDYIHCQAGHEICYQRGPIPTLNGQPPVDDDTTAGGGPWWLCTTTGNDCDDTLTLLTAPA